MVSEEREDPGARPASNLDSIPEIETGSQLQTLQHLNSLPLVMSACNQLSDIYGRSKDYSRVVKYGLETAEAGIKMTSAITRPVVNKLEKPVSYLDEFTVDKLERIEKRLPILTKPTEEAKRDVESAYNNSLAPTINRITAATLYGVDSVRSVKDRGVSAVTAIGQSGMNTINTVAEVNKRGLAKVSEVTSYGTDKLDGLMDTRYGQVIKRPVESILDKTENYVEHYLPPVAEEDEEEEETEKKEGQEEESDESEVSAPSSHGPVRRAGHLGGRVSYRVYRRAINAIIRGKQTVEDVIYANQLVTTLRKAPASVVNGIGELKGNAQVIWQRIIEDKDPQEAINPCNECEHSQEERFIHGVRAVIKRVSGYKQTYINTPYSYTKDKVGEVYALPRNAYNMYTTIRDYDDEGRLQSARRVEVFEATVHHTRRMLTTMYNKVESVATPVVTPVVTPVYNFLSPVLDPIFSFASRFSPRLAKWKPTMNQPTAEPIADPTPNGTPTKASNGQAPNTPLGQPPAQPPIDQQDEQVPASPDKSEDTVDLVEDN